MEPEIRLSTAAEIMIEFARSTGLSPAAKAPRRYLWSEVTIVRTMHEPAGSAAWMRRKAAFTPRKVGFEKGKHEVRISLCELG